MARWCAGFNGFISVEAESESEARDKAREKLNEISDEFELADVFNTEEYTEEDDEDD